MSQPKVHLINHTHWDREWFLTSVYTSRWIPGLIDRLEKLAEANPSFSYWLDGQTLVVEDLLALSPGYEPRLRRLIADGNLEIGPYYCQPDWQITGGEALVRNLVHGRNDARRLGGRTHTGWLVDTFGHIRQSPQIHRLAGVDGLFVWRGVPAMEPYFEWQAPDGSQVLAVYLLGGYRNLYGVTHEPETALRRLTAEVERLAPYHPTPDIPLFDGYDLEDDPEDPLRFFRAQHGAPEGMELVQSTPEEFVRAVRERGVKFAARQHELNSGKYGAVFPGTLTARIYLKLLADDCERLLYRVCEPLAALAAAGGREYPADLFEHWSRVLLQNAVHDGICGVSIDTVHEKMEHLYRQVFNGALVEMQAALEALLAGFTPGNYAVSLSPTAAESYQVTGDSIGYAHTGGVGVFPMQSFASIERPDQPVEAFSFNNQHYQAQLNGDGSLSMGQVRFGLLRVSRETGDTYSEEGDEALGTLALVSPLRVLERSEWHAVAGYEAGWQQGEARVSARVRVHFDPSPIVRWTVELDSRGTELRVDLEVEHGGGESVQALMPFDCARRDGPDSDLLPRILPEELAAILLGQRELNAVRTFPFQGGLALGEGEGAAALFARGLRAYTLDEPGRVRLPLRRAVEWLTRAGLKDRTGDAGPFFYVPDARCERSERHELGIAVGGFDGALELAALNEQFQNPPLITHTTGGGEAQAWTLLREDLPLSSLHVLDGRTLARLYNPGEQPVQLSRGYAAVDWWGQMLRPVEQVAPGQIVTVELPPVEAPPNGAGGKVTLLTPPTWRVGESASLPDPAVIAELGERAALLERELRDAQAGLESAEGDQRLRIQHRAYVLEREMVEYLFSRLLNQRRLARQGPPTEADLFEPDAEVAELGLRLNKLRIKRRIFDYVVGVLKDQASGD